MNSNLPIDERVKGYGILHADGEFEFTPVRHGQKTGKMRLLKETQQFSYYEGRHCCKVVFKFEHMAPHLLTRWLLKAMESFILYFYRLKKK